MKTLFVGRISFDSTEKKLKREFEVYGPINKIRLIKNIETEKSRGYCFIEYEHKRDMISILFKIFQANYITLNFIKKNIVILLIKKVNNLFLKFFKLIKAAYKQADGKKIDGRRVLVDCERGRTVKDWKPRRFGGGRGDTRRGRSKENAFHSISKYLFLFTQIILKKFIDNLIK